MRKWRRLGRNNELTNIYRTMTKEETKKQIAKAHDRIALMQAYVDDKQIQFFSILENKWVDTIDPSWSQGSSYRVKPEPNYRPFKNAEECWHEMQKHHPFGWIKDKNDGHYSMITTVDAAAGEGKKHIGISGGNIWTLSETMCDYTFADGEPFGINIEEE